MNKTIFSSTLISDPLTLTGILALVVFGSLWLEQKVVLCSKLGSAFLVIFFAMVLSNLGIIPGDSPVYDFTFDIVVSAAIILILLGLELKTALKAGPTMLKAFVLGAIGAVAGTVIMGLSLAEILGPENWKLCGMYAGTYVGGSVNFAAVTRELNTSPDLFNAALVSDVFVTALWLMVCLAVPLLVKSNQNKQETASSSAKENLAGAFHLESDLFSSVTPVSIIHFSALIAITFGIMVISGWLGSVFPFVPEVLILTVMAILIAQIKAVNRIAGTSMLGNYLLLYFLVAIAAKSVFANVIAIGPEVFYFALGAVVIHGIIIFGGGWLLNINMRALSVASQANIGGVASAIAIAGTRGYKEELGPGIAVSLLGYMIGNFIGLGVAYMMLNIL